MEPGEYGKIFDAVLVEMDREGKAEMARKWTAFEWLGALLVGPFLIALVLALMPFALWKICYDESASLHIFSRTVFRVYLWITAMAGAYLMYLLFVLFVASRGKISI
jgi:hypothetical protein